MGGRVCVPRKQGKIDEAEKRVSVEGDVRKFNSTVLGVDIMGRTAFNHCVPGAPEFFGGFDFANSETRSMQLHYASGERWGERGGTRSWGIPHRMDE